MGESDPGQTVVTVLHPPGNVETTPAGEITVAVHNTTRLECRAEGKPRPKFQWVQGGKVSTYILYIHHKMRLLMVICAGEVLHPVPGPGECGLC